MLNITPEQVQEALMLVKHGLDECDPCPAGAQCGVDFCDESSPHHLQNKCEVALATITAALQQQSEEIARLRAEQKAWLAPIRNDVENAVAMWEKDQHHGYIFDDTMRRIQREVSALRAAMKGASHE